MFKNVSIHISILSTYFAITVFIVIYHVIIPNCFHLHWPQAVMHVKPCRLHGHMNSQRFLVDVLQLLQITLKILSVAGAWKQRVVTKLLNRKSYQRLKKMSDWKCICTGDQTMRKWIYERKASSFFRMTIE